MLGYVMLNSWTNNWQESTKYKKFWSTSVSYALNDHNIRVVFLLMKIKVSVEVPNLYNFDFFS